ncbi:receptor-like protein 18 [Pistacia vera]|uniref:receptor-like protein 18 n=1 Tax=Pistacia vera TaxID=55513 RepID=UPI0012638538|nr:receptor-like protein 18 [Pistacia vera]
MAGDLQGNFPEDIFCLPFLKKLSLTGNEFLTGTLPKYNWSSSLRFLDLFETNFSGKLSNTIGNLKYLKVLDLSSFSWYLDMMDLSFNKFKGLIPTSFWNCTKITSLDLSGNNFTGEVATSLSKLSQLKSLNLSGNNLEGKFPDVFGNLSKLTDLDLSLNNFSGQLLSSTFNLSQLSVLDFSENQVQGHIPFQVSGLSNLISLKMSDNFLAGRVPSWLFTMPSLETLDLSNNKLTGPIEEFHPPGSVKYVSLMNNEIRGSIPNSMFELLNLTSLYLSSNNLSDNVNADKLSKLKNLVAIDLSHNTLLSFVNQKSETFTSPNLQSFSCSSCHINEFPIFLRTSNILFFLDLSNNRIHGKITQWQFELFHNLLYLNLSHNFLTSFSPIGKTSNVVLDLQSNLLQGPLVILDAPLMDTLLLSHNMLTGEIPSSICNLSDIHVLDLSNNSLSGTIPQCLGNAPWLSLLNLKMNNFHVLNVGNNMINDTFPHWLAKLPDLQILILRSNRFHGSIEKSKARLSFRKLRIIDISHNQFTGHIPPLLENLTQLESLDFPFNNFVGKIPNQLTSLTFLSVLNLSYNQLVGSIPQGNQFDTFQNDSYIGNFGLCGSPLSRKCIHDEPPSPVPLIYHEEDDESSWFDWKIALMGYECGFVLGLSIGYIAFTTRKPQWFIRKIERENSTAFLQRRVNPLAELVLDSISFSGYLFMKFLNFIL